MRKFEYNDQQINEKQFFIAVATVGIGIVILVFQRELAEITVSADGMLIIIFGGAIAALTVWLLTKFVVTLNKQTVFEYASSVLTKPITIILFFLYSIQLIVLAAYEVRKLTDITQHYLLEETPIEVLALSFLLVSMYAVAGSRVGLFRLNTMFMPFVLIVSVIILIFNIPLIDVSNLMPIFQTKPDGYIKGLLLITSVFIAGGAGVILFYTSIVETDKSIPKMAVLGTILPVGLFLLFYFVAIGVFGNTVTANLLYASIELGKTVNVPGGIFERFESIFFVIWIMAVFNLTTLLIDLAVLTIQSIFQKMKKIYILFLLIPIIFFVSVLPQNVVESAVMGEWVVYAMTIYPLFFTLILFVGGKMRGGKASG